MLETVSSERNRFGAKFAKYGVKKGALLFPQCSISVHDACVLQEEKKI